MIATKPIISRIGSKQRLAPWIADFILQHDFGTYIEPFCGTAAIYLHLYNLGIANLLRDRGYFPRFVLNDKDKRIINLYQVCRDCPELLAYAIANTPYSREEHRNAIATLNEIEEAIDLARNTVICSYQSFGQHLPGDNSNTTNNGWRRAQRRRTDPISLWNNLSDRILNTLQAFQSSAPSDSITVPDIDGDPFDDSFSLKIEAARTFLTRNQQGRSGDIQSGWSYTLNSLEKRDRCRSWQEIPHKLLLASQIFKEVHIECDDAIAVMKRWSNPLAFFYLDPPYLDCEHYYKEKIDHQELAETASQIEAAGIAISYYSRPDLENLYPRDRWDWHEKKTLSCAGANRNERVELLLVRKDGKLRSPPQEEREKQLELLIN